MTTPEKVLRDAVEQPEFVEPIRTQLVDMTRIAIERGASEAMIAFEMIAHGYAIITDKTPEMARTEVLQLLANNVLARTEPKGNA